MASEDVLFTVGPPPHKRSVSSVATIYYIIVAALFPAAALGAILYGFSSEAAHTMAVPSGIFTKVVDVLIRELGLDPWFLSMSGAFGVLFMGMGLGLLAEFIIQMIFRQQYLAINGHGALMGLVLTMMVPLSIPWWVLLIGIVVAILLGKQLYGGLGAYPFHPAMLGILILLVAYPHYMNVVSMNTLAAVHPAVIVITGLGGLGLIFLGVIQWQIPLGVILGVAVSGGIFKYFYPNIDGPHIQLISGHVMLAAFFLATDHTSSPANRIPAFIFGLGVGAMIMLIRVFGIWADAVPFAVVLMNILSPLLDRIRPRPKKLVMQNG